MVFSHSRETPGEDVASTHKIRAKEKIDKYFFFPIILPPTKRSVDSKFTTTPHCLVIKKMVVLNWYKKSFNI
jgi:hypothetical protein